MRKIDALHQDYTQVIKHEIVKEIHIKVKDNLDCDTIEENLNLADPDVSNDLSNDEENASYHKEEYGKLEENEEDEISYHKDESLNFDTIHQIEPIKNEELKILKDDPSQTSTMLIQKLDKAEIKPKINLTQKKFNFNVNSGLVKSDKK